MLEEALTEQEVDELCEELGLNPETIKRHNSLLDDLHWVVVENDHA